MFHENKAKV